MFRRSISSSFLIVLFSIAFHVQSESKRENPPEGAAVDISFINATWSNAQGGPDFLAPANCLKLHLQAAAGNNFTGTSDYNCEGTPNTCSSLDGQINLNTNDIQGSFGGCTDGTTGTFQGTIDPSHTSMTLDFNCPSSCDPPNFSLTFLRPAIGILDVSQSSGIANQSVQTSGVQWIDYDRDKRLDLYLVGKNGNALFKNLGNGKFKNVTATTKTGNNGKDARGASWADIDNDGDPDLFIANASGSATLLENKKRVFVDISGNINGLSSSAVALRQGGLWLDINNDANIDLFQVFEGGPNLLAKNTGSKKFTNVTSSAGVLYSGTGRAAVSADLNNDGYQDIYLVNHREPNRLYINNKNETFTEMSASAGINASGGFTQVIVSDYDKDEDFDIFVVNNEGSSILYRNEGNLKFKSVAPATIKAQKKGIAAAFHDFDGDKDEDLILVQTSGKQNLLFENTNAKFKVKKGIDLSNPDNPTGIAIGDFNRDGFPDIAIGDGDATQENGDSLFQNTGGGGNNYLTVALQGKQSQRDGIGSTVVVQTGFSEFQRKTVTAGNGQNQSSFTLDFGLGTNLKVDFLRIFWPSGIQQTLQDVDANQRVTVVESAN